MIRLTMTARDLQEFEELSADEKAAEITLHIALTHHHNSRLELIKRGDKMWDDVAQRFGYGNAAEMHRTGMHIRRVRENGISEFVLEELESSDKAVRS